MDARLRKAEPNGIASAALKRLLRYCHKRLGHLDKHIDINDPDAHLPMTLEELEQVTEALSGYFNATSIGAVPFLDLSALGAAGCGRSDVDQTLDWIAIQSPFVTHYAEDPEWWWQAYRPRLTEGEFQFLEELRRRMGMPAMESRSGAAHF